MHNSFVIRQQAQPARPKRPALSAEFEKEHNEAIARRKKAREELDREQRNLFGSGRLGKLSDALGNAVADVINPRPK